MPGFLAIHYAHEGTLTINGVSMNRAAWMVGGDETGQGGLLPLYYKLEKRGDNRLIPAAAGTVAYPKRVTETTHSLRLAVNGDVDLNGAETANSRTGLAVNLKYIADNVVKHSAATASASLALSGMTTISGNVQVIDMIEDRYNLDDDQAIWTGTLRLLIPSGFLA